MVFKIYLRKHIWRYASYWFFFFFFIDAWDHFLWVTWYNSVTVYGMSFWQFSTQMCGTALTSLISWIPGFLRILLVFEAFQKSYLPKGLRCSIFQFNINHLRELVYHKFANFNFPIWPAASLRECQLSLVVLFMSCTLNFRFINWLFSICFFPQMINYRTNEQRWAWNGWEV